VASNVIAERDAAIAKRDRLMRLPEQQFVTLARTVAYPRDG
jgi:hypothetical protein